MKNKQIALLSLFILFCLVLTGVPAAAQEEFNRYEGPIISVDLGVTSLSLAVGESYTIPPVPIRRPVPGLPNRTRRK